MCTSRALGLGRRKQEKGRSRVIGIICAKIVSALGYVAGFACFAPGSGGQPSGPLSPATPVAVPEPHRGPRAAGFRGRVCSEDVTNSGAGERFLISREALASSLVSHKGLRELHLGDNAFGDLGAKARESSSWSECLSHYMLQRRDA